MIASILQPGYLPWLGFFEQMQHADVFIIYDDVQYDKHSWRNRNRIKTSQGVQWLTVPVIFSLSNPVAIRDVQIDNTQKWQKKHLSSICQSYSKASFYKDYIDSFESIYMRRYERLIDLDMDLINLFRQWLGIYEKPVQFSSELGVKGERIERLITLCKRVGANVFYEGAAGNDYINPDIFETNGVTVEFQNYQHPTYRQLHGEFIPFLSVIDLIFNHGKESLAILANTRPLTTEILA